jgi:hypothetical protein
MPRGTPSSVRTGVARHLENKRSFESLASKRSRRALGWVNFFVADVEDMGRTNAAHSSLLTSMGSVGPSAPY